MFGRTKSTLPTADEALRGREARWFGVSERHVVLDAPVITDDVPPGALGIARARQTNIEGYADRKRPKKKD